MVIARFVWINSTYVQKSKKVWKCFKKMIGLERDIEFEVPVRHLIRFPLNFRSLKI